MYRKIMNYLLIWSSKCNFQVPGDANSLKELGNTCVKNANFKEAVLLYTQAIKLEPENDLLHSNRSLAYLRLKQYSLAIQDANKTIQINPMWAKVKASQFIFLKANVFLVFLFHVLIFFQGYFRKGEVESAVGLLDEAYESYELALQLLPNDRNIMEALIRVSVAQKKKAEGDSIFS